MSDFPEIKSAHSLVAKHVTKELWEKLSGHETATSGFTLAKAIACAVQFDDQHCGPQLSTKVTPINAGCQGRMVHGVLLPFTSLRCTLKSPEFNILVWHHE